MSRHCCGHLLGGATCSCCGQTLGGGTWLLYDETPITVQVTPDEGMVSLVLGPDEQVRLDFLDPDPPRAVRARRQTSTLLIQGNPAPRPQGVSRAVNTELSELLTELGRAGFLIQSYQEDRDGVRHTAGADKPAPAGEASGVQPDRRDRLNVRRNDAWCCVIMARLHWSRCQAPPVS